MQTGNTRPDAHTKVTAPSHTPICVDLQGRIYLQRFKLYSALTIMRVELFSRFRVGKL